MEDKMINRLLYCKDGDEYTEVAKLCKEIIESLRHEINKTLSLYSFNGYRILCFYMVDTQVLTLFGYHEDDSRIPCGLNISIFPEYAIVDGTKKIDHNKIIDVIQITFNKLKKF